MSTPAVGLPKTELKKTGNDFCSCVPNVVFRDVTKVRATISELAREVSVMLPVVAKVTYGAR